MPSVRTTTATSLVAGVLSAAAFCTPYAAAASKYVIPLQGAGAMTLGFPGSPDALWTSADDPSNMLVNVTSRLRLSVPVIGPARSHVARRLVIRLPGVGCYQHCSRRIWRLRLRALGPNGY